MVYGSLARAHEDILRVVHLRSDKLWPLVLDSCSRSSVQVNSPLWSQFIGSPDRGTSLCTSANLVPKSLQCDWSFWNCIAAARTRGDCWKIVVPPNCCSSCDVIIIVTACTSFLHFELDAGPGQDQQHERSRFKREGKFSPKSHMCPLLATLRVVHSMLVFDGIPVGLVQVVCKAGPCTGL